MAAETEMAVDATETGDYAAGIKAMSNPKLPFPDKQRAARSRRLSSDGVGQ